VSIKTWAIVAIGWI